MFTIGAKNSPFAVKITVVMPKMDDINERMFLSLLKLKQQNEIATLTIKSKISNKFHSLKTFFTKKLYQKNLFFQNLILL